MSCSAQSCCVHFLCLSHPDYLASRDRGTHRKGVQHPGEEVEGVQRGADSPARPPLSRHEAHLRVQTACGLHQLWRQLLFSGKPSSSAWAPQELLQSPLPPWIPQIQGSLSLTIQEGFLLWAIRNGAPASLVTIPGYMEPGTRPQP